MRALLLPSLVALAACHWHAPPKERDEVRDTPTTDPTSEADVRRWLLDVPGVSAVDAGKARWDVIATDDGTRRDLLASEVCRRLSEHGFATPGMEIIVRDGAARDHVIGRARCAIFPARG